MAYKRPKHLEKYTNVSQFTGPLINKETKEPKMCDRCKTERATWIHEVKLTHKAAYLCFGCGDH